MHINPDSQMEYLIREFHTFLDLIYVYDCGYMSKGIFLFRVLVLVKVSCKRSNKLFLGGRNCTKPGHILKQSALAM